MKNGTIVTLALRKPLYVPEKPIRDVFFPIDSVVSIVTHMRDGNQIDVDTIAREGMSAFPLLMGASSSANDCSCQVRGRAVKIDAGIFRTSSSSDTGSRQLLDRYLQAYVNMLGQLASSQCTIRRRGCPIACISSNGFVRKSPTVRARSGADSPSFFLFVDDFKLVNDSFGHSIADKLLQALTTRFGGNEFAILLSGTERRTDADMLVRGSHAGFRNRSR